MSGSLAQAEDLKEMSPPPQHSESQHSNEHKQDSANQGGPRSDKFEKRGKEMFEKTDADKDGFLTKDEMEASHRARMEEMFNKTDLDKDGKLSPDELQKGRESMRDKFRQKYKEGKNGPKGNHEDGSEMKPDDKPMVKPTE
jgi:Ca2+-binding EF-hand superfamily protein